MKAARSKIAWWTAIVVSMLGMIFGFGMVALNILVLAAMRFAMIFGIPERGAHRIFYVHLGLGIALAGCVGMLGVIDIAWRRKCGTPRKNAGNPSPK